MHSHPMDFVSHPAQMTEPDHSEFGRRLSCVLVQRAKGLDDLFLARRKTLASGANNRIQVWDSKNGKLTFNPSEGHLDPSRSICYSPDGDRIVSGSSDKTICIWDASSSTLLLTWQGHPDGNFFVTYSYDGSYILSRCKDGSIQVRDAYNGKLVRELIKAHEDCVTSICFSQ